MSRIRSAAKTTLSRLGLFERFRYSGLHFLLMRAYSRSYLDNLAREREFYRRLFAVTRVSPRLVFDVGANVGDKTMTFTGLGARVVAVEPDPTNVRILGMRFRRNAAVAVVQAALGATRGRAMLYQEAPGSAFNTLSRTWADALEARGDDLKFSGRVEVEVMTLDELIATHGIPDYIKIDVEGYESAVISGLAVSVPLLSFEANVGSLRDECMRVVDLLGRLNAQLRFSWAIGHNLEWPDWRDLKAVRDLIATTDRSYLEVCAMPSR